MQNTFDIFSPDTWPIYLLGFVTFVSTLLENTCNPKKETHHWTWFVQDFLYTMISIALGIGICYALETSQAISYIVSIVMGLCGSSFIRLFRSSKDKIAEQAVCKAVDKVTDKISDKIAESFDKDKNQNSEQQ